MNNINHTVRRIYFLYIFLQNLLLKFKIYIVVSRVIFLTRLIELKKNETFYRSLFHSLMKKIMIYGYKNINIFQGVKFMKICGRR